MVFKKGHKTWNKGKRGLRGKDSPLWKGDKATYSAIHKWVQRNKNKADCCVKCGKIGRLELANISGEYKREIDDYEYLCCKCHRDKDKWFDKIKSKVFRGPDGKFRKI